MTIARQSAGGGGIPDFQSEVPAFYETYQPVIQKYFEQAFHRKPDMEDEFNAFYRAMALQFSSQPVTDPEQQVRRVIMQMSVRESYRKMGGQ